MTTSIAAATHDALTREACGEDPARASTALEELIAAGDADPVATVYREAPVEAVREHAMEAMAGLGPLDVRAAFFETVLRTEYSPYARLRAICAFQPLFPHQALRATVDMLGPGDPGIRASAARLLADAASTMPEPSMEEIHRLYEAFLFHWDEAVTDPLGYFLSTMSEPSVKVDVLVGLIEASDWLVREHFDARCAALSLGVMDAPAAKAAVAEDLIHRLHGAEWSDQVTGLIAALLVALLGSRDLASRTVNQLAVRDDMAEDRLRELRLELGGRVALRPVLEEAENAFAAPLQELFTKTMSDWKEATRSAQAGFKLRVAMSIIVFAAGLAVTLVSAYRVIFAGAGAELWGPGVSLAAGLAAMLVVVYKGPLADVQKSVVDLADTDIAFISFMHRLQFTTGLMQSEYAHGRMTKDSIAGASSLLGEALEGWTRLVHDETAAATPDRAHRPS